MDNDSKNRVTEKLLNKYHKVFEVVSKYNKDQVHLFLNNKIPPVTQKSSRIPYKMRYILTHSANVNFGKRMKRYFLVVVQIFGQIISFSIKLSKWLTSQMT